MLNMNIDMYEKMTPSESWSRYGWGADLQPGSTVFRSETEENVVMVGVGHDGTWWCEIEGDDTVEGEPIPHWNMIGQGWGDTADMAIDYSVCDCIGAGKIKGEACCEDAVNVLAYEAYQFAYGETPLFEMERGKIDGLFVAACRYVKNNIGSLPFDWEEF